MNDLSRAASVLGKKGGARTLEKHGVEHFTSASKKRWEKKKPKTLRP